MFLVFPHTFIGHSDRSTAFVSRELTSFLSVQGIATSYSSPYHPEGNRQCERANQTIWKTVRLLLRSNDLAEDKWELVLPTALHAIRLLVYTATNQTPHERLFSYSRRATFGAAMPSWLLKNGTVLLRRFVRNKDEPFCDRVELLSANLTYARTKYTNGRESTVSTSDFAPYPHVESETSAKDEDFHHCLSSCDHATCEATVDNGEASHVQNPTVTPLQNADQTTPVLFETASETLTQDSGQRATSTNHQDSLSAREVRRLDHMNSFIASQMGVCFAALCS